VLFELAAPLGLTFVLGTVIDVNVLLLRPPPIGSLVLVAGTCRKWGTFESACRDRRNTAGTSIRFANHAMRCDDDLMLVSARVIDATQFPTVDAVLPVALEDAEYLGQPTADALCDFARAHP
jgi:hypothetical protein